MSEIMAIKRKNIKEIIVKGFHNNIIVIVTFKDELEETIVWNFHTQDKSKYLLSFIKDEQEKTIVWNFYENSKHLLSFIETCILCSLFSDKIKMSNALTREIARKIKKELKKQNELKEKELSK